MHGNFHRNPRIAAEVAREKAARWGVPCFYGLNSMGGYDYNDLRLNFHDRKAYPDGRIVHIPYDHTIGAPGLPDDPEKKTPDERY